MSLRHIYLSHAGEDAGIATTLGEHLRNAGHDTRVDTLDLSIGDNVIRFMNDGLAEAHTVIILLSVHLTHAIWQKLEIDSAIWNEHAQNGGRCLVIRLDDSDVPPLLGPKIYGVLKNRDNDSLQALVDQICRESLERPTASTIVSMALQRTSKNPFRHLRAEFFEDRPDLHARAFAAPDARTLGSLHEMKPTFLEGSRGSGKSMLLLSLRSRNYLSRRQVTNSSHLTTDQVTIFGFYVKLTRGAICNAGVAFPETTKVGDVGGVAAQLTDLSEQELILQIVESMLSELHYCIESGLVTADKAAVKTLSQSAASLLFEDAAGTVGSLEELLSRLGDAHKRLAAYIRRRFIYGETPVLPNATFDLPQLKRVRALVGSHVAALSKAMFVVLLDEYENLLPYQQPIVNSFMKLGPPDISVKVAKKLAAEDTSATTAGQELQEPHDYGRIVLVYDVEDGDDLKRYHELLRHMVHNLCGCERIEGVDADIMLPRDDSPEIPEDRLLAEVAKLAKLSSEDLHALPIAERREKLTYYGEAAVYRVLLGGRGRHSEKRFSGFRELAFISSGVIRYFQEILGVAYHLTYGSEGPPTATVVLPSQHQSRAVHVVSQHNLTTLSRNVEVHGEELKYFLLDLGDCLRHKLLKHGSEPEAARLTIQDPEMLGEPEMLPLRRLLSIGMREGVFQTKEGRPAFRPKHSSDPQPSEFAISRLYAPVLQLSPRLRWRSTVTCQALLALVQPGNRARAMSDLKARLVRQRVIGIDDQIPLMRDQQ